MNTHLVLKKLSGPDGEIKPGTEVDASEWRNAPLLVRQRYLKPLDGVEAPREVSEASATELPSELDQRVIDIVAKNIREGGELAQLLRADQIAKLPVSKKNRGNRASRNQS